MTEETVLAVVLAVGVLAAAGLVVGVLLDRTDRTVTGALAHGAGVLAALAMALAHTTAAHASQLTNLRGPR
ncbi:hypothetical protein QNO07_09660 [Streptomyces sp. 549]|uniref:hypothetical protein n=1 Tax=Streptomyces sp. 549 TaxID=3049076 RepID=UPI0024C23B96|nr:hypothetical protein [Streptomyces sp. 549]MDK1473686.1 hypothetical protein [Streptomyces sp. 549]